MVWHNPSLKNGSLHQTRGASRSLARSDGCAAPSTRQSGPTHPCVAGGRDTTSAPSWHKDAPARRGRGLRPRRSSPRPLPLARDGGRLHRPEVGRTGRPERRRSRPGAPPTHGPLDARRSSRAAAPTGSGQVESSERTITLPGFLVDTLAQHLETHAPVDDMVWTTQQGALCAGGPSAEHGAKPSPSPWAHPAGSTTCGTRTPPGSTPDAVHPRRASGTALSP
jgi:hypothetical protein